MQSLGLTSPFARDVSSSPLKTSIHPCGSGSSLQSITRIFKRPRMLSLDQDQIHIHLMSQTRTPLLLLLLLPPGELKGAKNDETRIKVKGQCPSNRFDCCTLLYSTSTSSIGHFRNCTNAITRCFFSSLLQRGLVCKNHSEMKECLMILKRVVQSN